MRGHPESVLPRRLGLCGPGQLEFEEWQIEKDRREAIKNTLAKTFLWD
ncbi:unnamed protein product, partial [marine sediment metagenome]